MASLSILFVLAVIGGGGVGHAQSFVSVDVTPEVKGLYGQPTVLRCTVNIGDDVTNRDIRGIWWTKVRKDGKNETTLLDYFKGSLKAQPGYSLVNPSLNTADVSLLIENTTPEHEGKYECEVIVSSTTRKGEEISLNVMARYGAPTTTSKPEKVTYSTGGVLQCDASGGYPEGRIRWFDAEQKEWTKEAEMKTTPTNGGLFHLSSRLTLQKENVSSNYTCAVFSLSGEKEEEATFRIDPVAESPDGNIGTLTEPLLSPKTVTPVVVIGSLIVGLLLVLLILRCRRQRRQCHHDDPARYEPPLEGHNHLIIPEFVMREEQNIT